MLLNHLTDDQAIEIARRYGLPVLHIQHGTVIPRITTVDLRDRDRPTVMRTIRSSKMTEVQSLLDAMRDTIQVGDYLLNNETQAIVRVEALDNTGDLKKVYFTDKRNAVRSVRLNRIHFDHKIRRRDYNWLGPKHPDEYHLKCIVRGSGRAIADMDVKPAE